MTAISDYRLTSVDSPLTGDDYLVEHCYAPEAALSPGQHFELGETYCGITMEADDVVAIDHMKQSEHHWHPCYEAFALESYIGIPVYLDDVCYGTLNFSKAQSIKIQASVARMPR